MIDDLLEIAEALVGRESGRPRQASLRRSVSSAYYAVFHALCKLCADELVGITKPWIVYEPIYRSVDHRRAKQVLSDIRKQASSSARLIALGATFSTLQEARHEADYDPKPFRFGRDDTRGLIAQARRAVESLNAFSAAERIFLAVHLVGRGR